MGFRLDTASSVLGPFHKGTISYRSGPVRSVPKINPENVSFTRIWKKIKPDRSNTGPEVGRYRNVNQKFSSEQNNRPVKVHFPDLFGFYE